MKVPRTAWVAAAGWLPREASFAKLCQHFMGDIWIPNLISLKDSRGSQLLVRAGTRRMQGSDDTAGPKIPQPNRKDKEAGCRDCWLHRDNNSWPELAGNESIRSWPLPCRENTAAW